MVNLMKKLETVDDEATTASASTADPNQDVQRPQPPKLHSRKKPEAEIEASIIVEQQPRVFSEKNKSSLEENDDTTNIKEAAVLA